MKLLRPCGLMDMASDFGSDYCGFESHRGRYVIIRAIKLNISFDNYIFFSSRCCLLYTSDAADD